MRVYYDDDKADLLYQRIDEREQQVQNRRLTDDIVLDVGEDDKIVGIEFLDASKHVSCEGGRGPRTGLMLTPRLGRGARPRRAGQAECHHLPAR